MALEEVKNDRPRRSMEDINKEYTALCAQAGQTQYKIRCFEKDLEALNRSLENVNAEASQTQKYEADIAAALAAKEAKKEEAPADAQSQ